MDRIIEQEDVAGIARIVADQLVRDKVRYITRDLCENLLRAEIGDRPVRFANLDRILSAVISQICPWTVEYLRKAPRRPLVRKWLEDNVVGHYAIRHQSAVAFSDQRTATLFKLFWGR